MTIIGWIIFALSMCFGFWELMMVTSASQAGLGDVVFAVSFFALTLLWGLLGITLIICGTIKNSAVRHEHHGEGKA